MSHVSKYWTGKFNGPAQKLAASHSNVRTHRGSDRKRTIGNATLVFDDGQSSMDCVVLDVSESGAKIRPADVKTLPENFEMRSASQTPYVCKVVRRKANYLGIQYVGVPGLAVQPT